MENSTKQIFEQLTALWTQFTDGHNAGTKKGAKEARLALGSMKKMVTNYRKASSAESKALKKVRIK